MTDTLRSDRGPVTFPREAVVLAGGLGTRLRAVVPDLPKPLAPIQGRPFLSYLLDRLERQGVDRVVLSVGFKGDLFRRTFGDRYRDLDLVYAVEASPLGTAGGIGLGLDAIRGEAAFVLNGDTFFALSLAAMVETRERLRAEIVMGVKPMADCRRYGRVLLSGERVVGFAEKGHPASGLINGGVFLLPTALRPHLRDGTSFEVDFLERRLDQWSVAALVDDGHFIDIGIPEDFAAAQSLLPAWTRS
ncbi:MAG: nucleotidyltransferase family protein [Magnetococcales bacterium]|nr:nucleotidyltransferase family protein [Magnetococcales bacterium]